MSQGQPRMQQAEEKQQQEPIRYGDVFNVSGDLASRTIAPEDASMMQAAETSVFGHTQTEGLAAAMQSAATKNEEAGFVRHRGATDISVDQGVTVARSDVPGARVTTEFVGGKVVGQYVEATGVGLAAAITGETLESTEETPGKQAGGPK